MKSVQNLIDLCNIEIQENNDFISKNNSEIYSYNSLIAGLAEQKISLNEEITKRNDKNAALVIENNEFLEMITIFENINTILNNKSISFSELLNILQNIIENKITTNS